MKKFLFCVALLALFASFSNAACNPWWQNCSKSEVYAKTCWGFDGKTCLCCDALRYVRVSGEPVCKSGSAYIEKRTAQCWKY